MILGKRVTVVMPAYNAARTLERTWNDLPHDVVDRVLLADDASSDATADLARRLGIETIEHPVNRGYGGNQKTCYRSALATGADIVVMVHPDYQYSPRLVGAMAAMVASGHYDLVLGSRILGGRTRASGMPPWRYVANRALTLVQNLLCGAKLSEYHTGFRAYSRRLLESIPFEANAEGFVFDNQLIAQALIGRFEVGEISCPTRYFPEASSIALGPSIRYGFGVLGMSAAYRLHAWGIRRSPLLEPVVPAPQNAAALPGM